MGCRLTCVFCNPWSYGCSQWNAITRRWQFWQSTLGPPWLQPALDYLKCSHQERCCWDWGHQPAWLLGAPLCPGFRDAEAALASDPSLSSMVSISFIAAVLFAVDSCCFLLKFNSVCVWKDKGANLLFLLEAKLHWRLDNNPLFMLLQNPTK